MIIFSPQFAQAKRAAKENYSYVGNAGAKPFLTEVSLMDQPPGLIVIFQASAKNTAIWGPPTRTP